MISMTQPMHNKCRRVKSVALRVTLAFTVSAVDCVCVCRRFPKVWSPFVSATQEGIEQGIEQSLQGGFNRGFEDGVALGRAWGRVQGAVGYEHTTQHESPISSLKCECHD